MDEYQNKGLTKWVPLKCLILKSRKFHYLAEQHVNLIKGKELDQRRGVVAGENGSWSSLLGRRRYLQV